MSLPPLPENQLWLTCPKPIQQPHLRVICIPFAGSGAVVFHQWPNALPPDVELWGVRLPGRETRLREPAFSSLPTLVAALSENLQPYLDNVPFVIFGHSMGALIGFELVRYWRDQDGPQPVHLLVSGHRAPHRPPLHPPVHHADKQIFLNRLKALGGTPARFFELDDLVEMMLPTLRADFSVWETYIYEEEPPLALPITVMGGSSDSEATEADFAAWRQHTTSMFELHLFKGSHFYFREDNSPLLHLLHSVLAGI